MPEARLDGVRSSKTVVLIGPVGVGKSVVGVRVAADLGRPFYDLDLIGDTYYVEVGQPFDAFVRMIDERGVVDAHRWWQPARAHAVQRVLETYPGAVVALGAGHSHFEDASFFELVRAALESATVVLLLPSPDVERSIGVLRRRCVEERGRAFRDGDTDFIADWVMSAQNRALADHVVYAVGDDVDAVSARVSRLVRE